MNPERMNMNVNKILKSETTIEVCVHLGGSRFHTKKNGNSSQISPICTDILGKYTMCILLYLYARY